MKKWYMQYRQFYVTIYLAQKFFEEGYINLAHGTINLELDSYLPINQLEYE